LICFIVCPKSSQKEVSLLMNGKEEIRTTINSINERIAFLIDRFILTDEIK
jgi:tRNA(Ser,Leu) C12 N-acetylase TAN1